MAPSGIWVSAIDNDAWCCVTDDAAILASATVPVSSEAGTAVTGIVILDDPLND